MATHITIPMARLIELEAAEHERDILRTENQRLNREAHTWSKAAETYAASEARLVEALRELLACHTESAGFSMSMLADRAEFDAMLQRSQERLEAAVGAARVALGA